MRREVRAHTHSDTYDAKDRARRLACCDTSVMENCNFHVPLRLRKIKGPICPSRSWPRVCISSVSIDPRISMIVYFPFRCTVSSSTYGAMITLAPGNGMVPMPSMVGCTSASHWSSSRDKVGPSLVYHEPAWLAFLVVIVFN